jgi:hypothetical protein
VLAQALAERELEEVGRRVVGADEVAARLVDLELARSPTAISPSATSPTCVTRPGTGRLASVTCTRPPGAVMTPVSPIWPPDSP